MENKTYTLGGGGATQPLSKNEAAEELYGDPTVWPHPKVWTRGQKSSGNVFSLNTWPQNLTRWSILQVYILK